jgi:hypothetical protein
LQSIFINDDLPTLLLPIKAYSGLSGIGHFSKEGLLIRYIAFLMCIQSAISKIKVKECLTGHVVKSKNYL